MNIRSKLLLCSLIIALLCTSALAASTAELQLAGIRLGRSALTVVQKYGNPSEVRIGAAAQAQVTVPGAPSMPSAAEGPPMGGMFGMPAGESDMFSSLMGVVPGVPAAPRPSGQVTTQRRPPEVTWVYKFPQNRTLEFIINADGRIMQIAAYGVEWPGVSTAKGIRLGHTYKDVMLKYGFPEAHERRGLELLARYPERDRAIFTLVGNTVVGITIALMD